MPILSGQPAPPGERPAHQGGGSSGTRPFLFTEADLASDGPGLGSNPALDAQRAVLSADGRKGPVSGAQWKDYEIGDLLGEGGMAAVYLARHRGDGRLVALKILPARFADDAAFRVRFEREARISQALESQHVVKVFGGGRYGPLCYLEMEFVDGRSLGDLVKLRRDGRQSPWTSAEAVGLAIQAARGLVEAGRHQLVHRDIKPGNLMLTQGGVVKIADFGIVKVLGEEAMTMTGTAMGTPAYMSPEQGRGDAVDQRSDLYSLGAVLYELLTLAQPFSGETADALIYQHHFVEPKLITELVPDADPRLQAVVFTCLRKAAEERYADAGALLADLEAVQAGREPAGAVFAKGRVCTGADAALARHGGGLRRHWKPLAAGLAGLVLLSALGVWWLLAKRGEAEGLRTRLVGLDQPQALPSDVDATLARLRALSGARDPQVARWTAKLARVAALRAQLAGPAGALDHAATAALAPALAAFVAECGTTDPLAVEWAKRLGDAERDLREARAQLAELDAAEVPPRALHDRLLPLLAVAQRLAGPDDPQVAGWAAKLAASDARIAALRGRLAPLDAAGAVPPALQASAEADLPRLAALVGDADDEVLRWSARARATAAHLAALRKVLAQLDAGPTASLAAFAGLAREWQEFLALSAGDDRDRARWSARVAAAEARREALRVQLGALGRDDLPLASLDALQAALGEWRAIAGDEAAWRAWQRRLDEARARIATRRQVLASLVGKEQLSAEEQTLLRTTVAGLAAVQALDPAEARAIDERLARDAARLVLLGERLAVLDRAADVDDQLRPLLDQYEMLAGAGDAHVKPWRTKFDELTALRRRLASCDQPRPLPPHAAEDLARLAALVGPAAADVRRWGDKLAAVGDLKGQLTALDAARPLPAGAADQLARLRALVGDEDADALRWSDKLARCAAFSARLRGLDEAYVPPAGAQEACDGLAAEIGAEEPALVKVRARLAMLLGPAHPPWASASGHDAHGTWAELSIGALRQRFRWIPPGSFTMGSPADEAGRGSDERAVAVRLTRGLWLADSECTQLVWRTITGAAPSYHVGDGLPVERVSWNDSQHFLSALAKRVPGGLPCRLPSEAEWEYACRAGAAGPFPVADGAQVDLDRSAVYARNAGGDTQPVRTRLANPLGLYDMQGNVWEWCADGYGPYSVVPVSDPRAPRADTQVIRGGSWGDLPELLRAGCRRALASDVRSAYVGLRIAIDADWARP